MGYGLMGYENVPLDFQEMIENYVHWNEDIGEWQLVSDRLFSPTPRLNVIT